MAAAVAAATAQAQTTISITAPGGTSGLSGLGTSNYHVSEQIYLASEVGQNITINQFGLSTSALGTNPTFNNVAVYMRHTANTVYTAGTFNTAGFTLVYNGTFAWSATGFSVVSLTTPFNYSQASGNLEVMLVRTDNTTHTGAIYNCTVGATNSVRRLNTTVLPVSGVTAMPLANSGFRAAVQLINVPQCAGTPTPGSTTASVEGACAGTPFTLGVQNSIGLGATYLWELDNGGGWTAFGTNAPTQTVTQSASTSYRCTVDCPAGGGSPTSATSTPITIPMATDLPVAFSQTDFPSNCWSRSGTSSAFLTRDAVNGQGMPGSGSARFNFFNAASGTLILTSPTFPALTGSKEVVFDVAGAKFTDTATDQIKLQYSTTGNAGPWTDIVTMTNAVGGDLNTGGEQAALFVPTSTQWRRLAFSVPAGANAIRFEGTSGFANAVYLDNIDIRDVLACATPLNPVVSLSSPTLGLVSWTTTSATGYEVEVRTSGAPGSGPSGLALSGTVAAPPFNATPLTFGQTYAAYVRGDCGIDGFSHWSSPYVFTVNYCTAGAANTNPANIGTVSNVSVAGINQANASIAGYVDFSAVTGSMAPGGSYPFVFTRSLNYPLDQFIAWVDWNGDLDWDDAGENVVNSAIGIPVGPLNGLINCPPGTAPGAKRLRIRRQYVDVAGGFLPNNTPCGNSTFGQVLDFTLNVCGPVAATTSITDDCSGGTFSIDVNIASNPGGAMTINWVATPGGPGSQAASLGSNVLPAFPVGTKVSLSVSNSTLCDLALGDHYSNCPVTLTCGSTITVEHCYRNGDPRTFTFLAGNPNETVTVTFVSGGMDPNDVIRAYSGTDSNGDPIQQLTGSFADLDGVNGTSTGSALFIEIDSDASGSCQDGLSGAANWVFEVECTPGCVDPDGSVSPNVDCLTGTFTLDVAVSFTGDGSTVDLEYTVNGAPQTPITGLGESAVETLGPYAIGTTVAVTLAHESDGGCDVNLGSFQPGLGCPPPNDDCTNATLLPINSIDGCPAGGVVGTTVNATNDGPAPTCNNVAGTVQDVWYRFNSGTTAPPIRINMSAGTATNYAIALYDGPGCGGALIGCLANSPTLINFTGATANTDYYLRVFTNTGSGLPGTFNLCISGSDCPAPATPTASEITNNTAAIGWVGPAGSYIVEYGPAATFTTPGTGATPGPNGTIVTAAASPVTLTGLLPNTQYRFFVRSDCGSPAGFSINTFATLFTTLASPPIAGEICGTAIVIPTVPATVAGSTAGFLNNYNTTTCDQNATGGRDVVYSYTPAVNQTLDLTLCVGTTSYDSKLMVYENSCAGTTYACQDDGCQAPLYGGGPFNSQITGLSVTAGNTYYFVVDGWNTAEFGNYTLQISVAVPAPANDACANAVPLTVGYACAPTAGTSVGSTQSVAPSTCSSFTSSAANDVWYSFVASGTAHRVTVQGLGAYDPIVEVRSGACNGTSVACVDATINGQAEVLSVTGLTAGETYLVRVYGWAGATGEFTICVQAPDCQGVYDGPALPGTACDDSNPATVLDVYDTNCNCSGVPCTTDLDLIWQPDGASDLGWELREQGTDILVQAGGGIYPPSPAYSEATCLPDGCFYLVVTDDAGDGIAGGGGYQLKINSGARLVDNLRDQYGNGGFASGLTSQIANGEGFCLPLGSDRLIYTSCDRIDWKTSPCGGEFVVANANPAVSAQFGVSNANSGYQMWWYDPNGGYSFKRFQSHSTSNGLPNNAVRACHFQLNSWSGNQLQEGVLYNVKVRGRVAGDYLPWGPACRLMVNNALAQCPRTKLMDIPDNQFLSCGQVRPIGTSQASLVHAKPVRRMNNNCQWVSANRYQFRFRLASENFVLVKTTAVGAGNYFVNTNGLQCGKTYEVDVRASFNGGSTWCVVTPNPNSVSDPAWGDVCELSTVACPGSLALAPTTPHEAPALRMHPNPNRGDQLMIGLDRVQPEVQTVSVDIFDAFGKRVAARTIAVQDGYVNTVLDLNGELASGLYVVNITAGSAAFSERLVIQP
jgi:hypothetical protein